MAEIDSFLLSSLKQLKLPLQKPLKQGLFNDLVSISEVIEHCRSSNSECVRTQKEALKATFNVLSCTCMVRLRRQWKICQA